MDLVFGHDRTVAAWLEAKDGVRVRQTPAVIVGVIDAKGVLRGAFVTTWKNDATAELHLYGKTSNDTWKGYFRWVFDLVHRLEIRTSKANKAIKKAAPKYGFKFEGSERDYYGPQCDALRFFMTPSQCRWLRSEEHHGKSVRQLS